jgi:hypothetical protein
MEILKKKDKKEYLGKRDKKLYTTKKGYSVEFLGLYRVRLSEQIQPKELYRISFRMVKKIILLKSVIMDGVLVNCLLSKI